MGGGKEGEDDEPDKMAIAIGRFGRLKRWIKGQIVKGCIGMKNKTIKAIRGGPRPEENEIALEVNPEMDLFQGENGDLKNRRALKVEMNHISAAEGGKESMPASDNFPDSSIG